MRRYPYRTRVWAISVIRCRMTGSSTCTWGTYRCTERHTFNTRHARRSLTW